MTGDGSRRLRDAGLFPLVAHLVLALAIAAAMADDLVAAL